MALTRACLRELIEPVPICPETADLAMAFNLLGGIGDRAIDRHSANKIFHERLVLVDEQQSPVGLVCLNRLLPQLMEQGLIKQTGLAKGKRQSKLSGHPIDSALIEPVSVLPGELLIEHFLQHWNPQIQCYYAITGDRGEFLGLLNITQLCQHLCDSDAGAEEATPIPSVEPSAGGSRHPRSQRPQKWLEQQILAQKVELERQVRSQQEVINHLLQERNQQEMLKNILDKSFLTNSQLSSFDQLCELLERLPLPLMLQTANGNVLVQNTVWRQQIEEWLDPDSLRREVSNLLEDGVPDRPLTLPTLASLEGDPHLLTPLSSQQPAPDFGLVEPGQVSTRACHFGSSPGTCICVCPLKNGQEKTFQFTRIPLLELTGRGTILASPAAAEPMPVSSPTTVAEQELMHPFCVAKLVPAAAELSTTLLGLEDILTPDQTVAPATSTPSATAESVWLILAQDITEQQQLARELTAKNADLIHLNRLKDEFLACISHELRTPLTAVLGLSSLLKDQSLGEMNQRQVHYAQLIYQSGRHLMAVVNDILDLTRMETGQLEIALAPVDIASVCSRAFEQAKQLRMLDDKQSAEDLQLPQFSLELEPGLNMLVADEQRLRQMLLHLLTNALKFTEPDQSIGLKVNRWGGWVAFTVWDTGIGIPADKQHLIFQKFQQLENPLTRRFEGTGLGLVLTQRLARLHGGDVTFISKEGQGSQFTILLPPKPPAKSTIAMEDEEFLPATFPGGRVPLTASEQRAAQLVELGGTAPNHDRLVLIVEVVPAFIDTLTNQLTGLGYRVVIARSGTEAVEKARRLQPCIIFLNPVLPLLSGWDVLTLLKSSPETQNIPVVVTTTKVDEDHRHRRYADGWLSVPYQVRALRKILGQLVIASDEDNLSTQQPSSNTLTVLHLNPGTWSEQPGTLDDTGLTEILHTYHYQVLEADDLDQAELLARVWKPNVVLFDGALTDPIEYFHQFSQQTFLASLPLVTLDPETTQAANQTPGLLVFPCLANSNTTELMPGGMEATALLQVIQIAAGYNRRSTILAVDAATLPALLDVASSESAVAGILGSFPKESEWLQALTQYLQTAGLRGLVGRSRQEVLQQLQSQSIDLLLICWTEQTPQPTTLELLAALQQVECKPPILVLDHRFHEETGQSPASEGLPEVLRELATAIFPPSLPMEALLQQIYQILKGQGS